MQLKLKLWFICLMWTVVGIRNVLTGALRDHIITNGYPATVGEVPYIVGLLVREGNLARWCGGSIIHNNWVLTAAHCTDHVTSVTVYYGATRRTQALFNVMVNSGHIIQHPDWPASIGNDIALIRTPHVGFWGMVQKIELPGLSERSNSYEQFTVKTCGWGSTYDDSPLPEWLQCVDLAIISNEQCSRSYGELPDSVLCVDTPQGRSICDGDSGGPLVTKENHKLVGITSFSDAESCKSAAPAGFARITSHLEWIKNVSGVSY